MDEPRTFSGARSVDATSSAGDSSRGFKPTRRQAILGAGVAAGALALAGSPFLRSLFESVSALSRPSLGIVAPPAPRYPDLLTQLEAGVRRGLAAGGQAEAPVVSATASNSAPSGIAKAAQTLIERSHVDLVLAYANPTQAKLLGDLAEKTKVPIVVVDPGAHVVTKADAEPRVLLHSLGYWQSVWVLGGFAAAEIGRKVFVISSLYECGFEVLGAFDHGLSAHGGQVVGTAITHSPMGNVSSAIAKAGASDADALFVAASGTEADEILRAIAADARVSRMPLLVPGLTAPALAKTTLSAHTALAWPASEVHPFELLGEDVARLVAAAVSGGAKALPSGKQELAGARGDITFDLAAGLTDVAVQIQRARVVGGAVTYQPVGSATSTAIARAHADEIVPDLHAGWLDVYGGSA